MRIGIDCRTILNPKNGERAGVGHYTTHLVRELVRLYTRDTFVLFFDHRTPASDSFLQELATLPHVEIVHFPFSQYKRYLPLGYSHVVVARALKQKNLDVFHSPAYSIPLQYNKPAIVTIHDLAIYKHASWFPPGQKFSTSILVPSSVRKAAKLIAVSQATAKSIRQIFRTPEERIRVIYEGAPSVQRISAAERRAVKQAFNLSNRFILFIGTIEPRKNLVNLVKAFDAFMQENHARYRDLQLVIAGGKGWKHEPVFRAISRARWSSNIRVLGYVSAQEKQALLQEAFFFAFPSLWEGFGLPVIEAERVGLPVLTSQVSSLPEVGGDGALYVDPKSIRSIQDGITTLVRYPKKRDALGRRGKEYSKQFSWKQCAKETYAVYKEVVAESTQKR